MSKINGAEKITDNRFLNLFKLNAETKNGKCLDYLVASRARKVENLKAINHSSKADAVAIFATTEDNRVVLIRQYRYAIGDYIYELPAGLIDDNEEAIKELSYDNTDYGGNCTYEVRMAAIKALRKQIPMKPNNIKDILDFSGKYYTTRGDCPVWEEKEFLYQIHIAIIVDRN